MTDKSSTKSGHDATVVSDKYAPPELIEFTSSSKSSRSEDAGDATCSAIESSIGCPADELNVGSDDGESVLSFDAGDESRPNEIEMDRSESVMTSLETEPVLRTQAGTARGEKPKFKSRDRSMPVAVIETEELQDEIQGLIDQLSSRFHNAATEMTAKMDEILRRIDDLERALH
ncbi:hypothetical protein V1520DRAFT_336945 [Lipomyces starkeyi]|uniref:Uncharacterized protein n=1 Tax=Lipomyces starkeyi NRRL Y-11557 TaxID=675824 RepID=A0A1E3QFF6_LIPST|nr:hypothetical protein LIPSTDRAFT_341 [Lipomyces starkeyi NRRL Y-11557]